MAPRGPSINITYAGVENRFDCPHPYPEAGDSIQVRYDPAEPLVADLPSEPGSAVPTLAVSIVGLGISGAFGAGLWWTRKKMTGDGQVP